MRGWKYDSYRHALAAKGIQSSKYYTTKRVSISLIDPAYNTPDSEEDVTKDVLKKTQPSKMRRSAAPFAPVRTQTTPETSAARIKGRRELLKVSAEDVMKERSVNKALEALDRGDFSQAVDLLSPTSSGKYLKMVPTGRIDPKTGLAEMTTAEMSSGEVVALRTALAAKAMQFAQSGSGVVPEELIKVLDPADAERITKIQSLNEAAFKKSTAEALESPLSRELKRDLPILAGQIADAPAVGLEGVGLYGGDVGQGAGVRTQIDRLGAMATKDNVATGREEDGSLKFMPDGVPSLKDVYGFADTGGGVNPVLARTPAELRRKAEIVQDQIDSLYGSKDVLSKVDLSAFERGNLAFKKGSREKLISAISELQSEEAKLRDRWELIGQTHKNMISLENHTSSFQKSSDTNPLWGIGKQGGDQLADQTTKLNKVREAIIKANNEVFARKRMLQYRLQRLDSSVPPETDVPSRVTRFEPPQKRFIDTISNPVVDSFRGEFGR